LPSARPQAVRRHRRTAVVAVLALAAALATGSREPALAVEPKRAADELIALTNIARTSNGLPALARDDRLYTLSNARSDDMIARNYFSHTIPPDNRTVVDIVEGLGVRFRAVGENIEFNNALDFTTIQYAQTDFMNSPHHRENVLNPRWDRIGAGVAQGKDRRMYTVVFMQTVPKQPAGQPAGQAGVSTAAAAPARPKVIFGSPAGQEEATGARAVPAAAAGTAAPAAPVVTQPAQPAQAEESAVEAVTDEAAEQPDAAEPMSMTDGGQGDQAEAESTEQREQAEQPEQAQPAELAAMATVADGTDTDDDDVVAATAAKAPRERARGEHVQVANPAPSGLMGSLINRLLRLALNI